MSCFALQPSAPKIPHHHHSNLAFTETRECRCPSDLRSLSAVCPSSCQSLVALICH
jgi:hypothetical protein